jgi:TonB-linked SusC/RagA family outer membrane protein
MKRITSLLVCLLLFGSYAIFGQNIQIKGTVTSADDGSTLPGAYVKIKGTNTGTSTDANGKYEVSVPSDATLVFSLIGMKSLEVPVNGRTVVDVVLESETTEVEEVIVSAVAAGTPKKKLSVSVSRVGTDALEEVPASSAATALQGKVSGVTVTQSAGNPGRAATIIIRGAKQLVGSQDPLIIVDGVMVEGTLADINVDDIESFEVVKGASASALYGSRAGNGVIVITTKSGKNLKTGEVSVRIRNEFGINRLSNKYDLSTHHQYVLADDYKNYDYTRYAGVSYPSDYNGGWNTGISGARITQPFNYMDQPYAKTYDLQKEMFPGNNFYTNYVAVEANLGKTAVMTSFENNHQGGIMDLIDGYRRQNFRLNLTQKINDKLTVTATSLYIKSDTKQPGGESEYNGGVFFNLLLTQPDVNLNLLNADGQPYQIKPDPWQSNTTNPLYPLWKIKRDEKRDRLISAFAANYAPFKWMNLDAKYAFELQNTNYYSFEPFSTYDENGVYTRGELYISSSRRFDETAQTTMNLQKVFGPLTAKAKLSYIYERRFYESDNSTGTDFAYDVNRLKAFDNVVGAFDIDNYTEEEVTKDGLGILSLDYKGKYILDGMYRMDGSSLFGKNERWAPYFRVSGAWRISEDFKIPGIQELKLRGAYGTSGQRPGFEYHFEEMSLYRGNSSKYLLGNEDLKPATSTEIEVGLNADFLKVFDFEATYSKTITKDQFVEAPQAVHIGGWQYRWINGGTIESYAWESTLGAKIIRTKDITWNARLIFDKVSSKITQLDVPAFQTGPQGQEGDKLFYMRAGEIFGTMYGYHFLTSLSEMSKQLATGESIDNYEINSDGYVIQTGTQGTNYELPVVLKENGVNKLVKIGNSYPKFNLKFTTNFNYKDIQFYMLWDWKNGGDIYNKTNQWLTRDNRSVMMDQYGKAENEKKTVAYYQQFYFTNEMNDFWVEDGSYLKLREASIYYNLGTEQLSKLFGGRNLLTFTNYSGYDPEVQTNTLSGAQSFAYDFMGYPNYRSFSGSLEIKF